MKTSFFTVSLDLELFWGVYDAASINSYGSNILGGREAIPKILTLFKKYNIHASWATVAMASFENKRELMSYLPDVKPEYSNKKINPYEHLCNVGENERDDPFHFGYSLVNEIIAVDGMEIGSHSFSHFYCLEKHKEGSFKADLVAAGHAFQRLGINTKSIIFCRNQYRKCDLEIARGLGFTSFRGNETNYLYKPRQSKQSPIVRLARLVDAYINITGHHVSIPKVQLPGFVNVPSSRFLRPIANNDYLENLRLNRIKLSMLAAAKRGDGFHLWWHPHNFGRNILKNISYLKLILDYYKLLEDTYGMKSLNMTEVATLKLAD